MAKAAKYLEWHGQQWRVAVFVPRKLQATLGKTWLKQPLGTADLKRAEELKWPIVARLKGIISQAARSTTTADPLEAEAMRYRLHADEEGADYAALIRAERIEATQGYAAAKGFYDLATGKATPLDQLADDFLSFKANYRHKTQGDFKRVLGWLADWLRAEHLPVTLEALDRKVAGRYIERSLCQGRDRKKASAYLGFLREYWKWLKLRGHAMENPWADQTLPAAARRDRNAEADTGKRAYTDDEIAKLIYGPVADLMGEPSRSYLPDLMLIAALSGMRLEEICQLRMSDCADGNFEVREGKTANARRTVPIHPHLAPIVARRAKDKPDSAFLLWDLPNPAQAGDMRSTNASKAFGRYRLKMKVDERPNGKAKSNIEFHSFRRWFIRKARAAIQAGATGFGLWTVADVVGHDDEGIKDALKLTVRVYGGKSEEEAKRALVEAVQLPPPPKQTGDQNEG